MKSKYLALASFANDQITAKKAEVLELADSNLVKNLVKEGKLEPLISPVIEKAVDKTPKITRTPK